MNNDKLKCPKCGHDIPIDKVLISKIENDFKERLTQENKSVLENEKKKMWTIALEKAEEKSKNEKQFLQEQLLEKEKKIKNAQDLELSLRKETNKLKEEKESFEIEKQRQLDAEREKIREETTKRIMEEHQLKDAEKDKKVNDMRQQIEELKRKAEQGSQQTQGEVLELELENTLKKKFPMDEFTPVPKGVKGADIIQIVYNKRGKKCGSITWEMKRTKNWSDGWVQKLKEDQRNSKADIAILISETLPKDIIEAGDYQGIYVSSPRLALNIGFMLRNHICEIADVISLEENKSDKKDLIWNYLMGPEFRGRINTFLEATISMRKGLESEIRSYEKIWAERDKLIKKIESSMAGLSGDIKGYAGEDLLPNEHLQLESSYSNSKENESTKNDQANDQINLL